MSRTIYNSPKDVRAIEVRWYLDYERGQTTTPQTHNVVTTSPRLWDISCVWEILAKLRVICTYKFVQILMNILLSRSGPLHSFIVLLIMKME